jgi:hypothetical protein
MRKRCSRANQQLQNWGRAETLAIAGSVEYGRHTAVRVASRGRDRRAPKKFPTGIILIIVSVLANNNK